MGDDDVKVGRELVLADVAIEHRRRERDLGVHDFHGRGGERRARVDEVEADVVDARGAVGEDDDAGNTARGVNPMNVR